MHRFWCILCQFFTNLWDTFREQTVTKYDSKSELTVQIKEKIGKVKMYT